MSRKKSESSRLILLLVFLLGVPVLAQEAPVPAAPRHSLWQVESPSNTVYLLGSIHLLKRTDYPLAKPLMSAFSNASIAVFEADMEQMESPESQLKIASKGQLAQGETLKEHLSAPLYGRFSKHLEENGLPAAVFDPLKPSIAAAAITVIELQKLGVDPQYGLDRYLFKRAREEGKTIVPLETVDFQISLVTEFTKEEGELLMDSTLKEIDNLRRLYGQMLTAWRTGDALQLENLLNQAMRESPVIYQRLVTDRNHRWLPKIEELLRGTQKAIVIVGAGHLAGNEGVLELLRKKGWKIRQL